MKQNKLIILILIIASLHAMSSCGFGTDKSKIANAVREHVEPQLAEGKTFNFVGLSNRRDTIFMGTPHPCTGVIYTVTDNESGEKIRHFADVILSDDYATILCMKELDFDPVKIVEEKIRETFKEKIREKLGE